MFFSDKRITFHEQLMSELHYRSGNDVRPYILNWTTSKRRKFVRDKTKFKNSIPDSCQDILIFVTQEGGDEN